MAKHNNYLRNDPFFPFSQVNIDGKFYKNLLEPIIKSLSMPGKDKKSKHSSQEFAITMLLNGLRGFSPNLGTQIMERQLQSLLQGKIEKYIKQTRILPHPSQMNKYAHEFSMEDVDNKLLEINRHVLKQLREFRLIPKTLKIAFDYKKQLYYGKKDDPHVIGILAEKGTKKAFKWHTCAIVIKGLELQVGSKMIRKGEKKGPFIREMIEYLESLGFTIELSVMDKEYHVKEVFKYLNAIGITYITPVKDSKTLKALKEESLKDPALRVRKYRIKDGYQRGKGYKYYTHEIGFYAKRNKDFNKLRSQYKNKTREKKDILSDIFVLASNQEFCAPIVKKKHKFYKVRGDYKSRWRIETSYREVIPFISYSTSKIPKIRNLYFIVALLLYNLWVIMNVLLHEKKSWQPKEPRLLFSIYLQDVFFLVLQVRIGVDPPDSEFCRTEEIKDMGCIII
ncbi:MAG: hypothetical protein ACFFAS_08740 [Promethearchaeota archaeon]